jgi:YYY domain-containing protein
MRQVAYVACWWLALEVIGLISFPLVSRVCSGLGDKGYSISKLVGLLILTYLAWMLSSLKLLPFGTISILVSFILLAALSLFLGRKHLRIANWPRKQIIISESVFALAFVMFLLLRIGKPDIYFSGAADAFFNFAFIESILQGDYFPPPDPWFAGESIPYYYGGHLMVAVLSWVTRVPPAIAFNIAGAMFAALAVCASYGLGYNITKRKLYGFVTAFFVCIVGYTSGFFQLMAFTFDRQVLGLGPLDVPNITEWLLWFDFWSAPWLVEGALVHYPYFSSLLGDLHSYWISIPFQLMFITLVFALYQRRRLGDEIARSDTLLHILMLGLCLGFFSILNTWEYPTYAIFTLLAFILLRIRPSMRGALAVPLAIFGLSFILYVPYYTSGGMSGFSGLGLVTARTSLVQFLEFGALFLFAACSLLFILSKREILRGKGTILIAAFVLLATILAAVLLDFQLLIVVVPRFPLHRRCPGWDR